MSQNVKYQGILGIFERMETLLDAIRSAQNARIKIKDVYSPVGDHNLINYMCQKKSPVRFITFGGAVTGLVAGFALAILTSLVWNIIVGGKPVTATVPFVVVGFEMTILLGAIFTLLALLIFAKLPFRKFPSPAYRPEFSVDKFGVWLDCTEEQSEKAREILKEAGALQVQTVVDPGGKGGLS